MMAFDFVSEVDKKFFSDNLLLNEDWDNLTVDPVEDVDDFVSLLDVDPPISPEEFMRCLPDELGLLEDGDILMPDDSTQLSGFLDGVRDVSDSSDSGLDCGSISSPLQVKDEPFSPASSHGSDTLLDCIAHTQVLMDTAAPLPTTFQGLPLDIKLESPPLTPEREVNNDPCFLNQQLNQPTNGVKIDFSTPQVVSAASLPLGSSIITTSNGIKVIQAPSQPTIINPNVAQFLNKKIKIQPKPATTLQPQQTPPPQLATPTPGKPLVLTPEQFAKLTSQGVLKFHNPQTPTATPQTQQLSQCHSLTTELTTSVCMPTEIGNVHEKLQKRQQRMIKNRESACLSRKRKKEYLSSMEQTLSNSADENSRLKQQNELLKRRIQTLQTENDQLKRAFNVGGPTKKVTCVMAVLLFVSLNFGPMFNIFGSSQSETTLLPRISDKFVHHHARNLLSFKENATGELPSVEAHSYLHQKPSLKTISAALERLKQRYASTTAPTSSDLMVVKALEEINIPVSMCPSYFNSSESQRLMQELNGWVLGHKAGLQAASDLHTGKKPQKPFHKRPLKKYAPPRKLKAAMKGKYNGRDSTHNPPGAYEVQLFTGQDRRYDDFFQAVQIRNDTFYVVSFRRDHLLLPATAHNKTMRPRMSLLMPALHNGSDNDTSEPPAGNIAMMQIDCEVMATKLLHVRKTSVPHNMADGSKHNHTHPSPPSVHSERKRKKWQHNLNGGDKP